MKLTRQKPKNKINEIIYMYSNNHPHFLSTVCLFLGCFTIFILLNSIYFGLMSFSLHSGGFKFFLFFLALIWSIPSYIYYAIKKGGAREVSKNSKKEFVYFIAPSIAVALVLIFILLWFFTTPLFLSRNYRNLIHISENGNFITEIEDYTEMKIPVVDKALAMKLGEKKLGEANLGSQYTINNYTIIKYHDELYWVAPIEYDGFFKWTANNDVGSPGYILISATNPDMEVEIVYRPFKYLASAYFNQDLERKMYFKNMSLVRDGRINFELDEDGNPMFVQAVIKNRFAFTGGKDCYGVIVLDATTGHCSLYKMGEEPDWVDRVVPTEIANMQINYWGKYKHGYFNTWFAKKELLSVSDGYNYIYHDGELYLYTGITSIGKDESIVGIVLCNLKNKNTSFYKTSGATEYSARKSAEGVVQDLGYYATYPCLINYAGEPTYFMALKDKEGLIKKYAYVNVTDYTKVGIGDTIADAQIDYNKNINITIEEETLTISEIKQVSVDGTSTYYIKFDEKGDIIYKANVKVSDDLPFMKSKDKIVVRISGTVISEIISYESV